MHNNHRFLHGSVTVEATLIMPLVILCVMAIIYFSALLYQKAHLQSYADDVAEKSAAFWDNRAKDPETGRIDIGHLGAEGLYWRLCDFHKDEKIQKIMSCLGLYNAAHGKQSGIDRHSILHSKYTDKTKRVNIEIKDFIVYKKLVVSVEDSYETPINKLLTGLGLEKCLTVKVKSEAVLFDPVEFIRTVDFSLDTEGELERKHPGFKAAAEKIRSVMGGVRQKVEELMK